MGGREWVKFSPNHGNQVTIPGDYLPKTYEARSFRILPLGNLLKLKKVHLRDEENKFDPPKTNLLLSVGSLRPDKILGIFPLLTVNPDPGYGPNS